MKVTLLLLAYFALFSVALSAVARYPKIPGTPGHCWTEITGPLDEGEERNIENQCSKAICTGDGTTLLETCGSVMGPNGATETDFSKPYPACCPQPK